MKLGKKYNQRGFTVHEMLLVILISIVLLALSVVGIVTYMRYLQLAQLDNSAKEIFLAAQNQAILLRSNQQLDGLVVTGSNSIENVDVIPNSDNTTQITVYYIHSNSTDIQRLLPDGSIDPTLRDGDFWITYEPESGSVIDVFFCDQALGVTEDNFAAFYEEWRAASKLDRMNRKPMVGYYGGESAESGSTISLRTPVINIYNEDTLRVEVTYWVPRTLLTMGVAGDVELDMTLTYQEHTMRLEKTGENVEHIFKQDITYLTYTYIWTLDSLQDGEKQFKELFGAGVASRLTYGDDFTVSAEVSYTGDAVKVNGARKSASNNSLFAEGSNGDTAYISCLRHLQNLDKAWSEVSDTKTKAVQQDHIQEVEEYLFNPIENEDLTSYDGAEFSIYALNIAGTEASAGMFGSFSGTAATPKTLENIRLVNTAVKDSNGPAGGLVGNGSNLDIDNCLVYWENRSEETTNLRDVLGDSDKGIKYQITSSGPAGGLAGILTDSTLTDCSASSLVQSTGPVGGLVGQGSGLEIDHSYAASYLAGPAAAGLVGDLTGSANISSSYAVGFIDSKANTDAEAAGLCLGGGMATVTSSYSAMLFTAADTVTNPVTNYPLCKTGNDYKNTHYLDAEQFNFQGHDALGVSYGDLIDSTQWEDLFGRGVFTSKRILQSHPYNLQTTLSLNTYIYPGLEKLDHWGDWGAQFQNGSLVYYEVYQDANGTYSYGFHISGLSDDKPVVEDGYAVVYKSTDPISSIGAVLTVTYQTADGETTERFRYGGDEQNPIYVIQNVTDTSGETNNYYLLPLPEEVVNSDYAAQDFYQKITITDDPNQNEEEITAAGTKIYYYSPHFANTVLSADEIEEEDLPAKAEQLRVEVRTPRHLYNLSKFEAYYSSDNQYRFLQQRDLDYGTYTGYKRFTNLFTGIWSQSPIGLSASSPFRCVYYGNYHSITGVVPAVRDADNNTYQYIGLFGYSTGVLQNIVYQMQEDKTISVTQSGSSSQTLYVGALAGFNRGTVDNCVSYGVRLQANGYQYSTIYLGGLAGRNDGTIQNSAVEGASITAEASMSHAYAGGFVGENTAGGIIDQCYAVGKVSVSQARYGTVYACGFAGRSSASLSRSYAAVYLLSDGDAQRYGFSPDSSRSCVYLNNGNFTYRDENYAALYEDPSATPVTWEALAGQADGTASEEMANQVAAVQALGMEYGAASDWQEAYPYPATVTIKDGSYIHYGQWPERMDLGTMGVYYWEKLTIGETSSYHISAISMTADNKVMKSGTLSTAHGDGGVVTEYGYGYFSQTSGETMEVTMESSGIGYGNNTDFTPNESLENSDANDALSELMGGKYTFHSYNTWGTEKDGQGLYTSAPGVDKNPPYGVWTLEQGAIKLSVQLNPFFADAMSCTGIRQNTTAPTDLPGTEKNTYEVRSIDQLQFINWNSGAKITNKPIDTWNKVNYPYLSYGDNWILYARNFYWEQTHDLDGNDVKDYAPIAGLSDPTNAVQGDAYAWFSGSYNGNDYTIQQLSITNNGIYNTTGLFGFTRDAELKNIILYSPDGTASVTAHNSKKDDPTWYAVGGLVGLAANTPGSNRTISNCAVAGYTIRDNNETCAYGGGGVGGLVGICNMALNNCTAVTNIEIAYTHTDPSRNVRVGGIAGSCQKSISGCYSGGSITLNSETTKTSNSRLHVGGIVGGYYMKQLSMPDGEPILAGLTADEKVPTGMEPKLNNCYTYVEVSDEVKAKCDSQTAKGSYYVIGGLGEIARQNSNPASYLARYENCWYLGNQKDDTALDRDANGVKFCTYNELSVDGEAYTALLNAEVGFASVTTETAGGAPLNGRYSFGSDLSLLGKDYPFPTILTQSSSLVASGKANVHYGNWPLAGIKRDNGGLPVNLDLFANYNKDLKGAVYTETLSLEGVSGGGSWEVTSADTAIATAQLLDNGSDRKTLSITGQQTGNTVVTVTYTTKDNNKYTLDIAVNVTAELRLAAISSPVLVFTSQTVQTPLELRDRNNQPLAEGLTIQLENPTVEFDTDYLATASVNLEKLTLTAESGANPGNTQITVGFDYTYLKNDYHATSSIALNLVTPTIELKPLIFTFGQNASDNSEMTVLYTGTASKIEPDTGIGTCTGGQFTLKLNDAEVSISDLKIAGFEMDDVHKNTILAVWAKNEDGTEQIGTLSIEAYYPKLDEASAAVQVQFQFDYAGSTHTVWKDLEVQIKKEPKEEGGGTEGTGTEEVQP